MLHVAKFYPPVEGGMERVVASLCSATAGRLRNRVLAYSQDARPTREEIADFLSALITVYVIVIIAWIVIQFVFAMGVRMPYSRWSNAVLDFLRDVSNPWLNLFRRLPLRIGPLDLSPIVAIIVLQILGGIIVDIVRP